MRRVGAIAAVLVVIGLFGTRAMPSGGAGPALYPELRTLPPNGM